jgi:hypothetical protein
MKKKIFALGLVAGFCSFAKEPVQEDQRAVFYRNNLSLQSALKASLKKCADAEAKATLEDTLDLINTLEYYGVETRLTMYPGLYKDSVSSRMDRNIEERTFSKSMLQSVLEAQTELHRVVASARKREDVECLRSLEITRSSLSTFLASVPSQPRQITLVRENYGKLPIPKASKSDAESVWDWLHRMVRKSARFANEENLGEGLKRYTFRTKTLNSYLNRYCDISITINEKTGAITLEWRFQRTPAGGADKPYVSGEIAISPGPAKIIPTGDNDSISLERGQLVDKTRSGDGDLFSAVYFGVSSDGSLDKIIHRHSFKKDPEDWGCSVTKFPTYEEDLPEIKVPSPTKPH